MNYRFTVQRSLRRNINALFGSGMFDIPTVQSLLGYTKEGDTVIDNLPLLKFAYNYNSAIGRALFFRGLFEEEEIAFIADKLRTVEKPVIFDIGANIGLHCSRWARACQDARIFAFEPSPLTRAILERNIAMNQLSGIVSIIPSAVADKSGKATFFHCEDNAFSSLKDTKRKQVTEKFDVPVTTIDEFVKNNAIERVSLIKIDVEGYETEAIVGATDTLGRMSPDLFVEIYGGDNSNKDPRKTIDTICAFGYQAYVLVEGEIRPYSDHSDANYNYYFTKK